MADEALVSDELWEAVAPLLPPAPPKSWGGRPRVPDRAALGGIIFVLRQGLRWRDLPQALGYGSGVTCWRRLRRWQELGVWQAVHHTRPELAGPAGRDPVGPGQPGQHQRAGQAGRRSHGAEPHRPRQTREQVPSGRRSAGGAPGGALSAANVHDSRLLEPLVDAIPPIWRPVGEPGRPRRRPAKLHADKAYDSRVLRRALRRRASSRASPAKASSPASASAGIAGSWSGRTPGSSPSAG